MPIESKQAANARLLDPAALTTDDFRDLIPWLGTIEGGLIYRLLAELALQNIAAIRKFDESSGKLSERLLLLTWALFGLTIVMTITTIVAVIPIIQSWIK